MPFHRVIDRYVRLPMRHHLRRIADAREGTSAIEFAIIVPLLLVLYFGAVDVNNALTVYRRTLQVATTAADLTAQVKSVSANEIEDIQAAATSIMTPYPTTDLNIVLSSVVADDNNVGKVEWSCASTGEGARAKGSSYPVPDGLTDANTSVVVAEVSYDFKPLIGPNTFQYLGPFTMEQTFYARPRRSVEVKKTDNGC